MNRPTQGIAAVPALLSLIGYTCLAYFTPRTQTWQVFMLVGLLFGLYGWLLTFKFTFKQGVWLAVGLRLVFLIAYPRLSDDYFRFIWDGTLVNQGENPFLHLPSYYVNNGILPDFGLSPLLYSKLNSPHYFSVYPPVCQYIFGFAYYLGGANILMNCLVMRVIILLVEVGSLFFIKNLLGQFNSHLNRLWWYAFNPLIIIELTGNLHFEGLMIFFLLGSIYFLLKHREILSAAFLALAISIKLLPLMLMPLLMAFLGWRRFCTYAAIAGLIIILLFLPFLSVAFINNLFTSLDLYFQKFEFNAGIYYVLRWVGFKMSGYNEIARLGPFLSIITFSGICLLGFYQEKGNIRGILNSILLAFTLYLSLATIVHPWYITTLVALSCITNWRYPLVWSGLVFLSYAAYGNALYKENYTLVFLEYLVVFGIFIWEAYQFKKREKQITLT